MPYVLGGRADTTVSIGAGYLACLHCAKAIQSSVRTPFAVSPALGKGNSFSGEKLKL